jgi:hypothetical protein
MATRAYRIVTPDAARMVIAETYRRGMLMHRHGLEQGDAGQAQQ